MTTIIRPFAVKITRGRHCLHNRTEIVEQQRIVRCEDCDASLDAFTVLLRQARNRDRLIFEDRSLKDQKDRAAVELEDVKRQLTNAKASLRRVGGGR